MASLEYIHSYHKILPPISNARCENYLMQTMRDLSTKVERLESAESSRSEQEAQKKSEPEPLIVMPQMNEPRLMLTLASGGMPPGGPYGMPQPPVVPYGMPPQTGFQMPPKMPGMY